MTVRGPLCHAAFDHTVEIRREFRALVGDTGGRIGDVGKQNRGLRRLRVWDHPGERLVEHGRK
jgi:hypothetical protein